MLVCSWFSIFVISITASVSTFNTDVNKVNIDLKTYIDIDDKDSDADIKFLIKNKEMTGDVKIIIDEDNHLHRKFGGKNVLTFTDFIYSLINILKKFNDNDLEYFCAIFDDEIRKYHYQGCRFYELTENTAFRKFVASKLGIIRQKPPSTIRNILAAIADEIEKFNFDEGKRDIVHLVNSLYKKDGIKKLKNFLNDIEMYGDTNIKNTNLVKIIRNGIRSIIFDHYTELHKIIRVELKYKMEEFFNNNLKTSTVVIAEITNAMLLDFNLSHINPGKKFRENIMDTAFANRRPNYVTIRGMRHRRLTSKGRKKIKTLKFQPVTRKPLRIAYIKRKNKTKTTTEPGEESREKITTYANSKTHTTKKKSTTKTPNEESLESMTTYTNSKTRTTKKVTVTRTTREETTKTNNKFKETTPSYDYATKNPKKKVTIKHTTSQDKTQTPQDDYLKIVTLKPYSPRNVTSFGKIHYFVNLNETGEVQTKVPGILFENLKPMRIMGVGTAGIAETVSMPVTQKQHVPILRREVKEEKNIIFYRSTNKHKPHRFQINAPNKFIYNRRSNEPISIKFGQNKNEDEINENVINSLRINVDEYLKKINITQNGLKRNSRKHIETNKVEKGIARPSFRGEEHTYDSFIRGKNSMYLDNNVNHFISSTTQRDPFIKGHTLNYGGSSTNLRIDYLNSNKETYQNETTDADKYIQSYFNNNTNEENEYNQKYTTSNVLEPVIMNNVKSDDDEIRAKPYKLPSYYIDIEKPKSHSLNTLKDADQKYDINYNKNKEKDNPNSGSRSLEDIKEITNKLNADAEKIANERKQQSASEEKIVSELKKYDQRQNVDPEIELKEKQTNNKIYFNRYIKDDDSTMKPYTETNVKFRQTEERKLSYKTQKTKAQISFISIKGISKEDNIELNKSENEPTSKPKSRFKIQSRNNNTDSLNTDINEKQTHVDHYNVNISTINKDGKLTNTIAINRRYYIRGQSSDRNIKSQRRNSKNDCESKDDRYISEADRTNQNNKNNILSNYGSKNIEQNIYKHKNEKTNVVTKSATANIFTENSIDYSDQTITESPSADFQNDIGTVTSFDLSKEITAPNLSDIDPLVKTLEEKEELADWLERKAKRRMNLEKSIRDAQDAQVVNNDFNLTSIYSDEVTNYADNLMVPPPTLSNDYE